MNRVINRNVMLCLSTSINFERRVRKILVTIILKFVFRLNQLRAEQLQNIEIK